MILIASYFGFGIMLHVKAGFRGLNYEKGEPQALCLRLACQNEHGQLGK